MVFGIEPPLFQLLVLTILLSVRIRADIAVDAARELFRAGWRTPKAMSESTWKQRVEALGRAHYVRYDESTGAFVDRLDPHNLANLKNPGGGVFGPDGNLYVTSGVFSGSPPGVPRSDTGARWINPTTLPRSSNSIGSM